MSAQSGNETSCPMRVTCLKNHRLLLLTLAGIVISYYFLCFTPGHGELFNYYAYLGESFLKGHTYLPFSVNPALLAKPDPYAPEVHRGLGMWDASLYNDRYYLYFGPVPVVVLWVPAKLLFGISLGTETMTYIFTTLGTIALTCILYVLMRRVNLDFSRAAFSVAALSLTFATFLPPLQHIPYVYAISLAGAYCFTAWGFLFLVLACGERASYRLLMLGGFCMGLAVGCRQIYILATLPMAGVVFLLSRGQTKTFLKTGFALFAPWGVVMAALFAYNYARFDSIFETGTRYQLTLYNYHSAEFRSIRPDKFLNNLFIYLFRPIEWKWPLAFPPFNVGYYYHKELPFGITMETAEQTHGLIANSPFVLFLFATICRFKNTGHSTTAWLERFVWLMGVMLAGLIFLLFWNNLRYLADFSPWLMFGACVGFIPLASRARSPLWLIAGSLLAVFGAFNGIMYAQSMPG